MANTPPPVGYSNWNAYIRAQVNLSPDQSIEAKRLIKRDIKLSAISAASRASIDITSPSYRPYNVYVSPGTKSPTPGAPWLLAGSVVGGSLLLQDGAGLLLQDGSSILLET
jgi:hypothetical protein